MSIQKFRQDTKAYRQAPLLKESFQAVYKILRQKKAASVLDIGCASGDFLYYLPKGLRGTGLDVSKELIALARARVKRPGIDFEAADFLKTKVARGHDALTLLGMLHTFLDFRPALDRALASGARTVIVHSPFNEWGVDTRHFHRQGSDEYQCGYSLFSIDSISRYLRSKGVKKFVFNPFQMKKTLKHDPANPLRNWHVDFGGQRRLTNGIGIVFQEYLLVIDLKDKEKR